MTESATPAPPDHGQLGRSAGDNGDVRVHRRGRLGAAPRGLPVQNPFVFCAAHRDDFPPGDERMRAPRAGNGNDFRPRSSAPFRMAR
ncbi:hypothetical protein HK405_005787, partial [Cladochytrium tenue]